MNPFDERCIKYIRRVNFKGGGMFGVTKHGRYYIGYAYRESKWVILFVNIRLFLMWLKEGLS